MTAYQETSDSNVVDDGEHDSQRQKESERGKEGHRVVYVCIRRHEAVAMGPVLSITDVAQPFQSGRGDPGAPTTGGPSCCRM
jgi:hypothetical protein